MRSARGAGLRPEDVRHALFLRDAHPGKPSVVAGKSGTRFGFISRPGPVGPGGGVPNLDQRVCLPHGQLPSLYPVLARLLSPEVTPPGRAPRSLPLPVYPSSLRSYSSLSPVGLRIEHLAPSLSLLIFLTLFLKSEDLRWGIRSGVPFNLACRLHFPPALWLSSLIL